MKLIKKYLSTMIAASAVILIPMVVGLLLWNRLPEQITIHWGLNNTPDGWAGKQIVVFGVPALLLAAQWVGVLLTSLDPKVKNADGKPMKIVLWLIPAISLVVCGVIYGYALGLDFNMDNVALLLVGMLFLIIGNYLPKCKQSYTLGIKLPWTLKSEANWNATHRFGGKVWMLGGLLLTQCVFLPKNLLGVAILVIMPALVLIPVVYSFVYYNRYDKK